MAIGSTLPPQAYTREMLAVAFNWLQSQPESVKKQAASPDALVGLYLRAQKFGPGSGEADAPVSSQNFIHDLKHLAEGLKQFEDPKDPRRNLQQNHQQNHQSHQPSHQANHPHMTAPTHAMHPPLQPTMHTSQFTHQAPPQTGQQQMPPPQGASAINEYMQRAMNHGHIPLQDFSEFAEVHPKSLQMIREVKEHLNLSTDAEAISLMVAIAYKNLKNLLV